MSFVDSLMAGLSLVANIESFLALAGGVVIGVIGGAIPGMSATMAVALTLPFTFAMQPITGILLLLGVYKGGIFGGCIPAILIKTPGTPASSATILDGYPMAGRGGARAGHGALGLLYGGFDIEPCADRLCRVAGVFRAEFRAAGVFHPDPVFTDHHRGGVGRQLVARGAVGHSGAAFGHGGA